MEEERKEGEQEEEEKKYIMHMEPGPVLDVVHIYDPHKNLTCKYYYPHLREDEPAVQRT